MGQAADVSFLGGERHIITSSHRYLDQLASFRAGAPNEPDQVGGTSEALRSQHSDPARISDGWAESFTISGSTAAHREPGIMPLTT